MGVCFEPTDDETVCVGVSQPVQTKMSLDTQWIDALSSYCVNAVKKSLSVSKIGHSGILDSYAEGVLLLAIGKSTRLLPVSFLRSFEI